MVKTKKKTIKKSKNPMIALLNKQRRQHVWRESLIFLFKNTSICTENYMNFERKYWEDFKNSITGHEESLRHLALISNRIKYENLPAKPAPSTLKEFKANQPKKLTKKAKLKEAKNPSLKPLPKVTLETAFVQNTETVAIDKYLDIIDRLNTLSKMAADFNKTIDKYPEELGGSDPNFIGSMQGMGAAGLDQPGSGMYASTASDLENNGEQMIAYWQGLSGAKQFKAIECGSVGFNMPALLPTNAENEYLKEKWRHLARTILRLAQNFVTYATRKTGIVINDSDRSIAHMRNGLSIEQVEIMDKLTKSILITPVTPQSVETTSNLLSGFNLSAIGRNQNKVQEEEAKKQKEKEELEQIPGRSDQLTLHLPDEPPKVLSGKKKKGKGKKYSVQTKK